MLQTRPRKMRHGKRNEEWSSYKMNNYKIKQKNELNNNAETCTEVKLKESS